MAAYIYHLTTYKTLYLTVYFVFKRSLASNVLLEKCVYFGRAFYGVFITEFESNPHSFTSFCFIVNFEQISFIVFTVHFEKIQTLFSCLYCYLSINTTNCHSAFIGFYFDQVAHIVLIWSIFCLL